MIVLSKRASKHLARNATVTDRRHLKGVTGKTVETFSRAEDYETQSRDLQTAGDDKLVKLIFHASPPSRRETATRHWLSRALSTCFLLNFARKGSRFDSHGRRKGVSHNAISAFCRCRVAVKTTKVNEREARGGGSDETPPPAQAPTADVAMTP
ncbi:hypothetical protein EVAR_71394_1 [Eumeta japonica]|uniref:Uncharacterized protein n=1 Tax=Eumeta variegata TaxID=151549 RepID=A0A4C2A766_EUMVA|nr:hypothetical protein EVAR_71394_1 [Eumeta japonica]